MSNEKFRTMLIMILAILVMSSSIWIIYKVFRGESISFLGGFKDRNMTLVDSFNTNLNDVDNIYLDLLSTDVEIKESKDEKILVEYYSNQSRNAMIEHFNNVIEIDEEDYNAPCIGICNVRRKVILYIPKLYKNMLEIETKSGDVKSKNDLSNNILNVKTVSGDIRLNLLDTADLSTVSGNISVDRVSKEINISTVSGDVLIKNLAITKNSNINTTSGNVSIYNNEVNCYIEYNTVSGDHIINKSDRKSDIVLKINTISGDIIVK